MLVAKSKLFSIPSVDKYCIKCGNSDFTLKKGDFGAFDVIMPSYQKEVKNGQEYRKGFRYGLNENSSPTKANASQI